MDRFEKFATFLKEQVPMRRKVVIRRIRNMKDHGSTGMSDKGLITVTINRNDPIAMQMDTLVHEWGHVYEYDENGIHGRFFGKGYSQAYEAWEEFTATEE